MPKLQNQDQGVPTKLPQGDASLTEKFRTALGRALASVKGREFTTTTQAFVFEEALDRQIEHIEGAGTKKRPGELARIKRVEQDLLGAVEQLKKMDDDEFLLADETNDVNSKT